MGAACACGRTGAGAAPQARNHPGRPDRPDLLPAAGLRRHPERLFRRRGIERQHPLHPQRRRPGRRPDQGRAEFRAVVGRRHHPERRARRAAAHDRRQLRQAQPLHHHAEEIHQGRGPQRRHRRHPDHDRRQLLQLAGDRAKARPEIPRRLQGAARRPAPARGTICCSTARSTSACSRSPGSMSPRTRASTISAPRPTMCRTGSSRSTT